MQVLWSIIAVYVYLRFDVVPYDRNWESTPPVDII